jgi:hypothetical protein
VHDWRLPSPTESICSDSAGSQKVEDFWRLGRWLVGVERFVQVVVIRTNRVHNPAWRKLSLIFVSCQGCFASRNVIPWHTTHGVVPDQTDNGILPKLMILPDDFELHLERRFTTDLFQMPYGELALGVDPFANRTRQLVVEVKRLGFSAKLDVDKYFLANRCTCYPGVANSSTWSSWRFPILRCPPTPTLQPPIRVLTDSGNFSPLGCGTRRSVSPHDGHSQTPPRAFRPPLGNRLENYFPILTFFLGMLTQYLTHNLWPKP